MTPSLTHSLTPGSDVQAIKMVVLGYLALGEFGRFRDVLGFTLVHWRESMPFYPYVLAL